MNDITITQPLPSLLCAWGDHDRCAARRHENCSCDCHRD